MVLLRFKWYILAVLILSLTFVALDYFGFIWHNALFAAKYHIKGLDVSHHQGHIDWQKVGATKKYSFVFIKATEGHDFTDDDFVKNWQGAKANGLLVGAYHFFSTRSSGTEQAEFFIAAVPKEEGALPPVIDIEIDLKRDPTVIRAELTALSAKLESYYQQ